jgi:phosphohistidine phosphatase
MDLYIIRHADAVALGERGITEDVSRPLSETGLAQARTLAAGLMKRGVVLDVVLTSPLLRARQTAEEMLKHWSLPAPPLQVCDALRPEGKSSKLRRFLRDLQASSVALVGHQPDLSRHTGYLIGKKKVRIDYAKGGVAHVGFPDRPDRKTGVLLWLVTPEWLVEPAGDAPARAGSAR